MKRLLALMLAVLAICSVIGTANATPSHTNNHSSSSSVPSTHSELEIDYLHCPSYDGGSAGSSIYTSSKDGSEGLRSGLYYMMASHRYSTLALSLNDSRLTHDGANLLFISLDCSSSGQPAMTVYHNGDTTYNPFDDPVVTPCGTNCVQQAVEYATHGYLCSDVDSPEPDYDLWSTTSYTSAVYHESIFEIHEYIRDTYYNVDLIRIRQDTGSNWWIESHHTCP